MTKSKKRNELSNLIAMFLSNGGKITLCKPKLAPRPRRSKTAPSNNSQSAKIVKLGVA